MNLNRYQRLAYENPCIDGQPPLHMPEGWILHGEEIDGQSVTVGVTVSVSAEHHVNHGSDAIWEISVSIWPTSVAEKLSHPQDFPMEVPRWTDHHKEIALKAHEKNVRGISIRDESPDPDLQGTVGEGRYAMHLHVPLNEEERAGLEIDRR